jgi:methylmalonyl-CoA mutase N-terminal domain/subunit
MEHRHIQEVQRVREERNTYETAEALEDIYDAAENGDNVIRPVIEAWKADATRGEMAGAIRVGLGHEWDEWGMADKPDWVTF